MSALPLHVRISRHRVLVVGGGNVGRRRVASIREAGGLVRLVDPDPVIVVPDVERIVARYESRHLDGVRLAFACAAAEVNERVVADAQARGVWVCDAAEADRGDVHLPAVVRRGDLTLTVSTGGASPALARRIAADWDEQFDAAYADFVQLLGVMRVEAKDAIRDAVTRRRVLEQLARPEWLNRVREVGVEAAGTAMRRLIAG